MTTTASSSFSTQQIPMLVLAMFLAAAAICWQPSSAAANFPQGQQRPFVKSSRMAQDTNLPAAAMAIDEQQYPVNSRFYRPAKFMPVPSAVQQQQQQYGFGGSRGGAAAAFNDWANDPAEQFLSLKRASLLARLASQSARGFGRRRK